MSFANYTLAGLALLSLMGCATSSGHPLAAGVSTPDNCPVAHSGHWQAWLEPVSGMGARPMLNISGVVDLPTPGYSVTLEAGPADRAMPPSQRFELRALPPSGLVAQVVTSTPVTYREAATYPVYRSIVIECGHRALATIEEVPARH